jgi:hypothetical protein
VPVIRLFPDIDKGLGRKIEHHSNDHQLDNEAQRVFPDHITYHSTLSRPSELRIFLPDPDQPLFLVIADEHFDFLQFILIVQPYVRHRNAQLPAGVS